MRKKSNNIVAIRRGLVADDFWHNRLSGFETELLGKIRAELLSCVPGLAEKFNAGLPTYFGYRCGDESEAVYIYVQKRGMVLDIRLPRDFEADLQRAGFTVKHRDNFQGRGGWLTGWFVPHDWQDVGEVAKWLRQALERRAPTTLADAAGKRPAPETPYPDLFAVSICGWPCGHGYAVSWQDGKLLYDVFRGEGVENHTEVLAPTSAQWVRFWQELDNIGVWSWPAEYANPRLVDGTSWGVHIGYHGQTIESSGSNAFPSVFEQFQWAVQMLIGGREFR